MEQPKTRNAGAWFAAFALTAGCSGTPVMDATPDADVIAADIVDAAVDAGHDVAPDAPALRDLFKPCAHDTDCSTLPGRARCLNTYPGGICTIRCTADRNCGPSGTGACFNGACIPACTDATDTTCDTYASLCLTFNSGMSHGCFPSCWSMNAPPDIDPTHAMCPMGTTCVSEGGACAAMAPMGSDNGGPCMSDTDCRSGRCFLEVDTMGNPTGWLGGYCWSIGRFPGNAAYSGTTLPQSNCPSGGVMFGVAMLSNSSGGGIGTCRKGCMTNADCRTGYRCNHAPLLNMTMYNNGACLPLNCNMAGMTCPSGYHCFTPPSDAAMPFGICVTNTRDGGTGDGGASDAASDVVTPDAGADAGLDATVPDVGVPDIGLPDAAGGG